MNYYHERYCQVHQNAPFYFHLSSGSLDDDLDWIIENKIENIQLSQYEPYCIKSINVLSKVNLTVKRLSVHIKNADLSRINDFLELISLSIGETVATVDFTGLSKVRELYLVNTKEIRGFNTMTALNSLTLVNVQASFFSHEIFSVFSNLSTLQILSGKLPESLNFLQNAKKLNELELFNIKTPIDLNILQNSSVAIQTLKIEKCRKVLNLETTLCSLKFLKYLSLIDSGTLESAAIINALSKLKTLVILGSSYFLKGDIDDLKKLDWVSIDDKKHYSLKNKDLNKKAELTLTTL